MTVRKYSIVRNDALKRYEMYRIYKTKRLMYVSPLKKDCEAWIKNHKYSEERRK